MKNLIALCFLIIAISSCNKKETNDIDYLIFGHFYGECAGEECVEIFKLSKTNLFEDNTDVYPNELSKIDGNFKELSHNLFTECQSLFNSIPEKLWDEDETTIGIPDAGDWGGIYVEYQKDGEIKFWLLDQMKSNVPDYLHSFIDEINSKIAKINE